MSATIEKAQAEDQKRDDKNRYRVTTDEYRRFRRDGFVVVRNLVSAEEIAELKEHTEDLMQGRLPEQQNQPSKHFDSSNGVVQVNELGAPPAHLSPAEKANFFLRIHMLHRKLALHERYLLHPRVLDVMEVLVGPDVLALQTMLFLKPAGAAGQGWHQDSYYIPTSPDTLCGAWIAIDDCDEQNGAMWFAKGSGIEPVHPPCPEAGYGFGDRLIGDVKHVKGVSNPDDSANTLSRVAAEYDQVLVSAKAGDVVFFNGHVLHRSKKNWSTDRYRRSFVSHYCNARSFTQWGVDNGADAPVLTNESGAGSFTEKNAKDRASEPPKPARKPQDDVTGMTNASHILARGDSHLPFAQTRYGTPCAAEQPAEARAKEFGRMARLIQATGDGLLGCAIADPTRVDDDDHDDAGGY